jgi:hypothetical protein
MHKRNSKFSLSRFEKNCLVVSIFRQHYSQKEIVVKKKLTFYISPVNDKPVRKYIPAFDVDWQRLQDYCAVAEFWRGISEDSSTIIIYQNSVMNSENKTKFSTYWLDTVLLCIFAHLAMPRIGSPISCFPTSQASIYIIIGYSVNPSPPAASLS